ncbi:EAL domain-containing protein [Methylobacter sp. S3L5C]|uniref:EAL domain-containing protein n=1 Tax=Methylobacter sp. S3L5C TaxID=2839024 RepID=UPI001FAB86BB|nr:EAL domain-containing protein [Methylobacter sp. S3L5C]UOA10347.1 EAL domain-containing protein [Methylobacter sp. S3L5C]
MTPTKNKHSENRITLGLLAGHLSVAAIGLMSLLGWVLDNPGLTTWKSGTIPMAPNTAGLSILFSITLGLCIQKSPGRIPLLLTTLFGWLGILWALLLLTLRLLDIYWPGELFGLQIPHTPGNISIGYISPITAFGFLLAYVPLVTLPSHTIHGFWQDLIAKGLPGLLSLLGIFLLLAYALETPLLLPFEKTLIPPALNTSLILLIISLLLWVFAARHSTPSITPDTDVINNPLYILVFVIFSAGTIAVTFTSYRETEQKFRHEVEANLLAIAKLKTGELIRWRMERLRDASLTQSISITAVVQQLLEMPNNGSAQKIMQDWLGKYQNQFGYDMAFLLDSKGSIHMSMPKMTTPLSTALIKSAADSLQSGQIMLQDFYRDEHDQRVYLALILPIFNVQDNNKPLGVIGMRIDPTRYLYPFIQHWPTPSTSAETLLVRRDNNDVLFLNDLRFYKDAALNLHMPLSNTSLPAVKAVLGQRGIVEGLDYRGVPVIAAVNAIPDSPWYLVTRIDEAEVYAPLRERMKLTLLMVSILVCSAGALIFLLWQQQRQMFYQRQLELTSALLNNEERHRSILHTTMDGFWLLDKQGHLLEVNETYCQMSGYREQELLTMSVADLEASETSEDTVRHLQNIITQGQDRFESTHRRKDGSIFFVEVSIQYQPIKDEQFVVFLQDISERKQAEEKLQLAASVFTHAREGIMITTGNGAIIQVNDAFSEITGYSYDEVQGQNPRLLSSGRQEPEFYMNMWHDLVNKGYWYGEFWNRRKNGEVYPVMQNITTIRDTEGKVQYYVALLSDITLLKEHESELERSAHYDPLTNLPNRTLLIDRLHQGIAQTKRHGQLLAVVFLDLDGFKAINDNYGHLAGDHLLITVANNMQQALREIDTLARIGGDEFIALLLDISDIETSIPLLTRILTAASQSSQFDNMSLQVSASMGVTFYPQTEEADADLLIRQADQAMYQAKMRGKNRYNIFDAAEINLTRTRHESLERIRSGLAAGEFVLYYQPKVNLRIGRIIGTEALIRWQHPDKGLLLPDVFLPLIENHQLSLELGEWVIETALTQIEQWHASGLNIPVSINIDALQLQQSDFIERLQERLKAHPDVRPGDLEMEVLETSAMKDLPKVSKVIQASKEIGVHFSLDDFGTGYSSLTYLKRLPVNQIKIDQSFVRDMLHDTDDLAIIEGVVALAKAFGLQVIAEGMETIKHGEMLLQLGCDLAQGYAIGYPMPAANIPNWAATWRPDSSWINRPSFARDDLPLLFASAEHSIWITSIENHIKSGRKNPAPNDLPCRFGKWLNTESRTRHISDPTLQAIMPLHQQVHLLATELLNLHTNDQTTEALTKLDKLHKLHYALLKQLKLLVKENWKSTGTDT